MPITVNNTLPMNWDSSLSYNLGDQVTFGNNIIYKSLKNGNINHIPATSPDWWDVLGIYKKDETMMPHGDYSGDESFWNRDNIYIDVNGYAYINGENTGINVKGKSDVTLSFDDLTPAQREQIRGAQGPRGEQGIQGPQGPEGPMGQVVLTPEQIAALKGDPGESAYQIWLDQGYHGSELDFLFWLRQIAITIDQQLSDVSPNPVANNVLYQMFVDYAAHAEEQITLLEQRIELMESRLKATYNNVEYNFIFGITDTGEYGYKKSDETQVIPFNNATQEVVQTTQLISSPVIADAQFDYHIFNPVIDTIISDNENFEGTSVTREISSLNDIDTNGALYTKSLRGRSLDEFADTRIYIYKDGEYIKFSPTGYSRYQVEEGSTSLINNGIESKEGIMFGGDLASYGYRVTVKVRPLVEGTVINYQIGSGTLDAELPSVVSGTNRKRYETGSFDTETYISSFLGEDEKVYFSSDFSAIEPTWEWYPQPQPTRKSYGQWNWTYYDIETDFGVDLSQYEKVQINSLYPTTKSGEINVSDITTTTMYFSGDEVNGLNGIRINPTTGRYEIFPNRSGQYWIECIKSASYNQYEITEIYVE